MEDEDEEEENTPKWQQQWQLILKLIFVSLCSHIDVGGKQNCNSFAATKIYVAKIWWLLIAVRLGLPSSNVFFCSILFRTLDSLDECLSICESFHLIDI